MSDSDPFLNSIPTVVVLTPSSEKRPNSLSRVGITGRISIELVNEMTPKASPVKMSSKAASLRDRGGQTGFVDNNDAGDEKRSDELGHIVVGCCGISRPET